MHGPLLPALALLFNALVWGLSWWPFRVLQQHGLHPMWATCMVYLFCTGCLLLLKPRAWSALAQQPLLWLLMAASGLTNAGFNWAVTDGDVVRVVLLFYLMPAWVVLLAWPLLGERPNGAALGRLALALFGLVVVLKTPQSPWPVPEGLADWLALLGGLAFALTNVLLRRLNRTPGEARMLAMFSGGAVISGAAAGLAMAAGLASAPPAPAVDWTVLLAGLSLAFLLGNMALQYGAARLRANSTSLIMLSEVLFASGSAMLLGAGSLSQRSLYGGSLILLAALLSLRAR